jgi:hypothetical protein
MRYWLQVYGSRFLQPGSTRLEHSNIASPILPPRPTHTKLKESGTGRRRNKLDPTGNGRTIYRWKVGQTTRSTTWTNTVRNRFRQKPAEIEAFRALEIGEEKWCKEHIPRKDNNLNDITDEGISLLDDTELWWEKQNLLWTCHVSRSKDRVNNDGSFVTHQIGAMSSTFTSYW